MQVISNPNGIDSQHQMLLNLFQNFVDIHSEDYENQSASSQLRKQMDQNIKREWNYFKCQINANPLNKDKINTYFHLLEKSLLENNSLENSPSHSPTIRSSQHQKEMGESSKSPNTRFLTINPNDVPKDAFKKNCFKRSTHVAQNRININNNSNDESVVPSNRIQQAHGYFSPQIQSSSDRQFCQVLQQFEKNTMKNARSPYYNQSNLISQLNFSSAVQLSNQDLNQQQKNNFIRPSQFQQQQQGFQNSYQTQMNSNNNATSENNSLNPQRGLIKVDDNNYNSPPIFPLELVNNQQQMPQQQQILSKLDNEENSASNSESSNTRNSQDIINNVSNSQQNNNQNILNPNSSPTLNNMQSNTSLQIENLKNQAQQFYKEYKSQQTDYQRTTQQDTSKNLVQNVSLANPQTQQIDIQQSSSSIYQQQQQPTQQIQSLILPISYISYEKDNVLSINPQIQINVQGNNEGQQHSHSLDYNQANNLNKLNYNKFHQYRALSPISQSTQNNILQIENRTYSPNGRLIHNPQNFTQYQQQLQPPQKPIQNALNYKNKLLEAANQAVPLNQYQVGQQQKSDQSINSNSSSNLSMNANNLTQPQNLAQQYGIQENQQIVQRYQSPQRQISSINSIQQQQINLNQQQQPLQQPANNVTDQQSIIDEMLRYQFKTKNVVEKTQLLETYMKNNSSAINSLFNQ
ncbi:hypothetical protein ABPG72_017321 [Tetrahymena utriculariae]